MTSNVLQTFFMLFNIIVLKQINLVNQKKIEVLTIPKILLLVLIQNNLVDFIFKFILYLGKTAQKTTDILSAICSST